MGVVSKVSGTLVTVSIVSKIEDNRKFISPSLDMRNSCVDLTTMSAQIAQPQVFINHVLCLYFTSNHDPKNTT